MCDEVKFAHLAIFTLAAVANLRSLDLSLIINLIID